MNHLRTDGGKAEAGNFFTVLGGGDRGEVVEEQSEARMGPVVEFANTGEREQSNSPLSELLACGESRATVRNSTRSTSASAIFEAGKSLRSGIADIRVVSRYSRRLSFLDFAVPGGLSANRTLLP
jgi:hypothetical protein